MTRDHNQSKRWRPRYSLTSLILAVTVLLMTIGWRVDALRLSQRADELANILELERTRRNESEVKAEVLQEYVNGLYAHAGKPLQDWMHANRPAEKNLDWENFPLSPQPAASARQN